MERPWQEVVCGKRGWAGGIASVLSVIYFLRLYKMFYLFSLLPLLLPSKLRAHQQSGPRLGFRSMGKCEKRILGVHLYIHTPTYIYICIPIYIYYTCTVLTVKLTEPALPRALRPNEPMNYFLPSSKFQASSSSSSTETDVILVLRKLRKRKVFNICNATTITTTKVTIDNALQKDILLSIPFILNI